MNDKLILKTYIYDSCLILNSSTFQKAIKKQKLLFYKDNRLICATLSPMRLAYIRTECGDSLKALENIIYEIGIIKGRSQLFYTIKGSGLCNACPELFAFYDAMGECVWLEYSNKYKVFKSLGDFNKVCEKFGIDSNIWYNSKYKRREVKF